MIRSLVAAALAAISVATQAQGFAMKNENGVSWVCAGVSADERVALDALGSQDKQPARIVLSFPARSEDNP